MNGKPYHHTGGVFDDKKQKGIGSNKENQRIFAFQGNNK
jgi:hypothetical protein